MSEPNREWIIQRCINAFRDQYVDWPGYCECLLTRAEMKAALAECAERWPEYGFPGHGGEPAARPVAGADVANRWIVDLRHDLTAVSVERRP
jgi:hypothetical protein